MMNDGTFDAFLDHMLVTTKKTHTLILKQGDKLKRDPLRYLKDPSQLEADLALPETQPRATTTSRQPKLKSDKIRVKVAFDKTLLKSASREEQCFEEARATTKKSNLTKSADNFNLILASKPAEEQSSQMDLDDDVSTDFSERDSFKKTSFGKAKGRVLFRNDSSFDRTVISLSLIHI